MGLTTDKLISASRRRELTTCSAARCHAHLEQCVQSACLIKPFKVGLINLLINSFDGVDARYVRGLTYLLGASICIPLCWRMAELFGIDSCEEMGGCLSPDRLKRWVLGCATAFPS